MIPPLALIFQREDWKLKKAFTLVELLVAVTILAGLVSMASGIYVIYIRESDEKLLRFNLNFLRAAIQHFYLDNGRYPLDGKDYFGNRVSFLDNKTSELVQGVHSGKNSYPLKRYRYIQEIPIDPTTNLANWKLYPHDSDGDWDPLVHDSNGNGIPDKGENSPSPGGVDEDPLSIPPAPPSDDDGDGYKDEDPPDVKNVSSNNPELAHY